MKRILCLWLRAAGEDCKLQIANCKLQIELAELHELAEWCTRYSPLVGMEQSPNPECLFLDITGLEHLFGSEEKLVEKVLRDCAERGLTVRAAVADTIGAAWAIAHYGKSSIRNLQFAICNLQSSLSPLPIESLRLPEKTIELLHQLGIRRIEQLEVLPREGLSSRFGRELLQRWDQAMGRMAEPLPAYQSAPRFQARWSPEYPTARRETIEAALEHLLGRIAPRLVEEGRGAMRLECRLTCAARETVDVSVGLFQPSAWAKHLFQLLQVQFERVRLPGPVQAVDLAATMTAPLERRQQELFAEEFLRPNPRHLAGLIDRLSNRLGEQAVFRARLVPEAQPELAYHYDSLVGRRASRRADPVEVPPRPVRLLAQPVGCQLSVASDCKLQIANCKLQIEHGRQHRIAQTWGPERIETGWWRGRAVGRDYYRVETTSGCRFWVFRRLKDDQWFLHGTFD
jgi:protein ImuB